MNPVNNYNSFHVRIALIAKSWLKRWNELVKDDYAEATVTNLCRKLTSIDTYTHTLALLQVLAFLNKDLHEWTHLTNMNRIE